MGQQPKSRQPYSNKIPVESADVASYYNFQVFEFSVGKPVKKACTSRRILSLKSGVTLRKKALSIIPLYERAANHRQLRRL
jgi:hypothetical protein